MANIPNQAVTRRVERIVERNRKLYGPQRSPRVTTDTGHSLEDVLTYFISNSL